MVLNAGAVVDLSGNTNIAIADYHSKKHVSISDPVSASLRCFTSIPMTVFTGPPKQRVDSEEDLDHSFDHVDDEGCIDLGVLDVTIEQPIFGEDTSSCHYLDSESMEDLEISLADDPDTKSHLDNDDDDDVPLSIILPSNTDKKSTMNSIVSNKASSRNDSASSSPFFVVYALTALVISVAVVAVVRNKR